MNTIVYTVSVFKDLGCKPNNLMIEIDFPEIEEALGFIDEYHKHHHRVGADTGKSVVDFSYSVHQNFMRSFCEPIGEA